MKTQTEIDELKRNWMDDPCWDIEDTEGFEDHRDELKAFADKHRAEWRQQQEQARRMRIFNEPAFARPASSYLDEDDPRRTTYFEAADGLTKREYFAAMALQGLLSDGDYPVYATDAVRFADALIEALNKERF